MTEKRSDGNGDLFWVALVLGALAWARFSPSAGWIQDRLGVIFSQEILTVTILIVGLVCAILVWGKLRRRWRVKRLDSLTSALRDAFPNGALSNDSVSVAWGRKGIKRVTVNYAGSAPDDSAEFRSGVADVVRHRTGWENLVSKWDFDALRVVFTRATAVSPATTNRLVETQMFTPGPSPVEVARAQVSDRLTGLLSPIFGVPICLNVLSWQTSEGEWGVSGVPTGIGISYAPTTRDMSENWRRRLEAIVSLKTPPGGLRWSGDYHPAGDRMTLSPRPVLPERIPHPGVSAWGDEGADLELPYGLTEDGKVASWALTGTRSKALVHTLVVGSTGGGKTTFMRSIIYGATGQGVPVLGCDPKRIELTPFRGWPGVPAIASTAEDSAFLIKAVHDLMMYRYELQETQGIPADSHPRVLFVLDEFLVLRGMLNSWWARNKKGSMRVWGTETGTAHPALAMYELMAVMSRSANIHLLTGVQRPDQELFENGGTRDQFRHRLSMLRMSPDGARMMWGNTWTGIDLPLLPGRAMASPDGEPVETQTYWAELPSHQGETVQALKASAHRHFADSWSLEGLDLSPLSREVSLPIPTPPKEATRREISPSLSNEDSVSFVTEAVAGDELVPGDRIIIDGEVQTVVAVVDSGHDDVVVEVLPGEAARQAVEVAAQKLRDESAAGTTSHFASAEVTFDRRINLQEFTH